jgi:hypothetical protein
MADPEWQVARQRRLIGKLEAAGQSTVEAEKTLGLMITVLATMRETQAAIQRFSRLSTD